MKVKRIWMLPDQGGGWIMEGVKTNGDYTYSNCPVSWRFLVHPDSRWMFLQERD